MEMVQKVLSMDWSVQRMVNEYHWIMEKLIGMISYINDKPNLEKNELVNII